MEVTLDTGKHMDSGLLFFSKRNSEACIFCLLGAKSRPLKGCGAHSNFLSLKGKVQTEDGGKQREDMSVEPDRKERILINTTRLWGLV